MIRKRWIFQPSQRKQAEALIKEAFVGGYSLFMKIDYVMLSTNKRFSNWITKRNYTHVLDILNHACSDIYIYDITPEQAPSWLRRA